MEERERGPVEVGDDIQGVGGYLMRVTHVEVGTLGIVWRCFVPELDEDEDDGGLHLGYIPSELPPSGDPPRWDWYGWAYYGSLVLRNGVVVGYVCFYERDARKSLEEHETEWRKTLEKWQPEPMQSKPTDIRLD